MESSLLDFATTQQSIVPAVIGTLVYWLMEPIRQRATKLFALWINWTFWLAPTIAVFSALSGLAPIYGNGPLDCIMVLLLGMLYFSLWSVRSKIFRAWITLGPQILLLFIFSATDTLQIQSPLLAALSLSPMALQLSILPALPCFLVYHCTHDDADILTSLG